MIGERGYSVRHCLGCQIVHVGTERQWTVFRDGGPIGPSFVNFNAARGWIVSRYGRKGKTMYNGILYWGKLDLLGTRHLATYGLEGKTFAARAASRGAAMRKARRMRKQARKALACSTRCSRSAHWRVRVFYWMRQASAERMYPSIAVACLAGATSADKAARENGFRLP